MSNETVTYSLEAVLTRIESKIDTLQKDVNQKIDTLQKDVTEIKIAQAEIKSEVKDLKEQVREMKGTQKNQIWALITLLGGSLITVSLRALFINNP
jgi:Skp family chaperone for outer membrane proteins